ncbi:MAG TPA: glycosyltransferase [Solirubrobacteraceae bacterium]|nr:glycosyltransferase [Solirubrobacteraceae bacterium]
MTALRVLGETAYPGSVASARVRVAGFAPYLAPHGVRLAHRPALSDAEYALLQSATAPARKAWTLARSTGRAALRRGPEHDLLLVHRLRLMAPLPGLDPPPRLDVYDLDDALFLGSAAPVNRRFSWTKQEARRCVAYLRRARLVTAGNAYLADHARRHGARVEVVPSCVAPERQPVREHADREILTVGWMGSQSTSDYLAPVLPVLDRLQRGGMALRLVVVGAELAGRAAWIEQRPWSEAAQAADLASFDIGIMPLGDSEWARGKCGYKLLQYFSAGVPAIASPVGVNAGLLAGGAGLAADTPAEWERALRALAADAAERRQRGAVAREFVERRYSYSRWAPELAGLLRTLAA